MAIFLTGSTGYLGSYIATGLLRESDARLALLVRAGSADEARERLWRSLQLHMGPEEFLEALGRIDIYLGDITLPAVGLTPGDRERLIRTMDSVIHCAASLNRKSNKACLNVNLRGTLAVVKLARAAHDHHGLRRFSDVSTVAVAGERSSEVVTEEESIDWNRNDYDPYAMTKKFCEHMVHELLPDVPITVFRPSIVLGDSRFPATTQFDMVRAFVWLAGLKVLPFHPDWRLDIVPADYVGRGVVQVHLNNQPLFHTYHLSSGTGSLRYREITNALASAGHSIRPAYLPSLNGAFRGLVNTMAATPRSWGLSRAGSLIKVFLPYLTFDTVFDNSRIVAELGEKPRPFSEYAYPLLEFAKTNKFQYPYRPYDEIRSVRVPVSV